jgi:hypothetical protein
MATFPNIQVGDLWTADLANSMLPNVIVKQATQTIISSTALQNDTELVISGAAGTFRIDLDLIYGSNTAAGLKTGWTITGTTTNSPQRQIFGIFGPTNDTGSGAIAVSFGQAFTILLVTYAGRNSANPSHAREWAVITFSTAWTIQIQWAQGVSTAVNTSVNPLSCLTARQIG